MSIAMAYVNIQHPFIETVCMHYIWVCLTCIYVLLPPSACVQKNVFDGNLSGRLTLIMYNYIIYVGSVLEQKSISGHLGVIYTGAI